LRAEEVRSLFVRPDDQFRAALQLSGCRDNPGGPTVGSFELDRNPLDHNPLDHKSA
jgi:hypothetical protein